MRLRTQLAIAFFVLAVLPLAGLTLYSYLRSQRAIRRGVQAEAGLLAAEMSTRVSLVAGELSERLAIMRRRHGDVADGAYARARREALAAAQAQELRLLLRAIVSGAERRLGAVPFVVDADGRLFAPEPRDEELLGTLGIGPGRAATRADSRDWVVAELRDPASGTLIGVARPVGEALRELRRSAGVNLALGLGLALVAAFGILPLSRRMTRHLASLTDAAERLGRGEPDVRVSVPHGREFARLAETFNRLSSELRASQERLIEQERLRKELEIGRRIQEELLPRRPLRTPYAEVGGLSIPAREVGGDFFNYFALGEHELALLVGDVSGKGVPAALLMASLQATIRARLGRDEDLARLVDGLDHEMASDEALAPYYTLFLGVLDGKTGALRYVNAGHHTQFVLRRDGATVALASTGRPPGLYPGGGYEQCSLALGQQDGLFLFTDGLVEAEDEQGEPFGPDRLEALLRVSLGQELPTLMGQVDTALREHRGPCEAADDATIVALRYSRHALEPRA